MVYIALSERIPPIIIIRISEFKVSSTNIFHSNTLLTHYCTIKNNFTE